MNESNLTETRKTRTNGNRKAAGAGPEKRSKKPGASSAAPIASPALPASGPPKNQRVSLEFFSPQARDIFVAGSFNDWNPQATRMSPQGNGKWSTELSLTPGTYEYRLVVDGVWTDDPMSAESAPNPYGGFNSVLRVPSAP